MSEPKRWCDTCQNTGTVDCHCGGDQCVCGQYEMDCPVCGGAGDGEDDDYCGPDLVCNETAYGSTQRLSFSIKVF